MMDLIRVVTSGTLAGRVRTCGKLSSEWEGRLGSTRTVAGAVGLQGYKIKLK